MIENLLQIMERLRDPKGGCPWDLKQSYASIVPSTLEEAYEVADTIEQGNFDHLREELGDLLFQVVFYCQLAREEGRFEFDDVVKAISEKLIHRHPHVFGDVAHAEDADVVKNWEALKAQERKDKGMMSVLADVPLALPALSRSQKLQKRAANVGFDWPDIKAVMEKLDEERLEFEEALAEGEPAAIKDELGDMMFCLVNLSRHLKLDAEAVLRQANQKFENRFHYVEAQVAAAQKPWSEHQLSELEDYWQHAKVRSKSP